MTIANTFNLDTDLNTSPYYSDYDHRDGYYRILSKPRVALQAREINNLQAMLQRQIDWFGTHIFREGSIVLGGEINRQPYLSYLKIRDEDANSNEIDPSVFVGSKLTANSSNVSCIVIGYTNGVEANTANTKTLYVEYLSGEGSNVAYSNVASQYTFSASQQLFSNTGYTCNVITSNTATGQGIGVKIDEGVVFAHDHFLYFPPQGLVVSKYSPYASGLVGFNVEETLVDYLTDTSLVSNAQGIPNYGAPGADRLKLMPRLRTYANTAAAPNTFIILYELKNGVIVENKEKPQYNIIKDYLADRTEKESGDYVVDGLQIRLREHLLSGDNGGLFTSAAGGNNQLLSIGIEAGHGVVEGYDFENLVTKYISTDKGIDTANVEAQTITTNYGNYVTVDELVGNWNVNAGDIVTFYNTAQRSITNGNYSEVAPTGSVVGTARIKTVMHESGNPGANNCQYRLYFNNLTLTNGAFSNAASVYLNNASTADGKADLVSTTINETDYNISVFPMPADNINTVRDNSGLIDNIYYFVKTFDVSIAGAGTVSVATGVASEQYPFSTGALNQTQALENFMVAFNEAANVALSGTASIYANTTVNGQGTSFTTTLRTGNKIIIDGEIRTITSITDANTLVVNAAFTSTNTGTTIAKRYSVGDQVDFANANHTITIASTTQADINLNETLDGAKSASVTTTLKKVDGREITKDINKYKYVEFDLTATSNTTGPYYLGVADVHKIRQVRRHTSSFTANTDGTDITDSFQVNLGNKNPHHYNIAYITPKAGAGLTSSHYLLVEFDYFSHDYSQGDSYFSVDSYPIDDANTANLTAITTSEIPVVVIEGERYNLRDCIDIRPVMANTCAPSSTANTAPTNPTSGLAGSNTYNYSAGGLKISKPNENFTVDYSYYLPRRDLITINAYGTPRVIRGESHINPRTPTTPGDEMALSVLYVAPYPSLTATGAAAYNRPEYECETNFIGFKRYTMRDIGVIDDRVRNLEYYVTLSTLEKEALDMKITDANGLDRFKNGIIVDDFTSHAIGDLEDPDYKASIDPENQELRSAFDMESFEMVYDTSSQCVRKGNYVYIDYAHLEYQKQPYATNARSLGNPFRTYIGNLELIPNHDYWVDTKRNPDRNVVDNSLMKSWQRYGKAWGIDWGSWKSKVKGKKVSTTHDKEVSNKKSRNGNSFKRSKTATTTTTITTKELLRRGKKLKIDGYTSSNKKLGDRVVDVSVAPWVRPKTIRFQAYQMKPNTRVWVFFDSELVDEHCTQISLARDANDKFTTIRAKGTGLITDSDGKLHGKFDIPAKRFRTGKIKMVVKDASEEYLEGTTKAEEHYNVSGLKTTKEKTILSTRVPKITVDTIKDVKTITEKSVDKRVSYNDNLYASNVLTDEPVYDDQETAGWHDGTDSSTTDGGPGGDDGGSPAGLS